MTEHRTIEPDDCPVCRKPAEQLTPYYDRHNIYSGKACSDECARDLPGQGDMWNYEADEDIEPEETIRPS
jgi:hypothetical protein